MHPVVWVVLGALALIVLWAIATRNSLVRKRVYIEEAWSSIDVQLKRKGNVIPNLVDTIKMQTEYEGELLERLTAARTGLTRGSNAERIKANDEVTRIVPSLYAVAESYPQLGSNESFRKLMSEVSDCEDKIAYARNRYNVSVSNYNSAIQVFPAMFIAGVFGFGPYDFFEIAEAERRDYDNMRIKDIK